MLLANGPAAGQPPAPLSQAAIAAAAAWQPSVTLSAQKPAPKPPAVDWNRRPSADAPSNTEPSVICGMTVVPADPKGDSKMAVTLPDGGGVKCTLRSVEPAICKAR